MMEYVFFLHFYYKFYAIFHVQFEIVLTKRNELNDLSVC